MPVRTCVVAPLQHVPSRKVAVLAWTQASEPNQTVTLQKITQLGGLLADAQVDYNATHWTVCKIGEGCGLL